MALRAGLSGWLRLMRSVRLAQVPSRLIMMGGRACRPGMCSPRRTWRGFGGFPEIGRGELVRTALLHVLTSGSD